MKGEEVQLRQFHKLLSSLEGTPLRFFFCTDFLRHSRRFGAKRLPVLAVGVEAKRRNLRNRDGIILRPEGGATFGAQRTYTGSVGCVALLLAYG